MFLSLPFLPRHQLLASTLRFSSFQSTKRILTRSVGIKRKRLAMSGQQSAGFGTNESKEYNMSAIAARNIVSRKRITLTWNVLLAGLRNSDRLASQISFLTWHTTPRRFSWRMFTFSNSVPSFATLRLGSKSNWPRILRVPFPTSKRLCHPFQNDFPLRPFQCLVHNNKCVAYKAPECPSIVICDAAIMNE